jgi:hypothetical protein
MREVRFDRPSGTLFVPSFHAYCVAVADVAEDSAHAQK